MHNKVGRQRWGYHYNLFPAYTGWTRDHLCIGRHQHNDLKSNELCLGSIQRRLEAFLGFLVKIKMKAYKKLTVVMCCQIVARKSVAPSSGDFCRGRPRARSGILKNNYFFQKINSPVPRPLPEFRECVTSMIF